MSTATDTIEQLATQEYKYGFETLIEADTFPPGLNEDVVRAVGGRVEDLAPEYPGLAHPRLAGALLTLPHRDRTDGFFVARLRAGEAP